MIRRFLDPLVFMLIAILFLSLKPADAGLEIKEVPKNLPDAVRQGLEAERAQLEAKKDEYNAAAERFDNHCSNVKVGSALDAECAQKQIILDGQAQECEDWAKKFSGKIDAAVVNARIQEPTVQKREPSETPHVLPSVESMPEEPYVPRISKWPAKLPTEGQLKVKVITPPSQPVLKPGPSVQPEIGEKKHLIRVQGFPLGYNVMAPGNVDEKPEQPHEPEPDSH